MAGKPGMGKYRATRGLHLWGRPQAEQEGWWEERLRIERAELAEALAQGDRRCARIARRWIADSERHLAAVQNRAQQAPQTGN